MGPKLQDLYNVNILQVLSGISITCPLIYFTFLISYHFYLQACSSVEPDDMSKITQILIFTSVGPKCCSTLEPTEYLWLKKKKDTDVWLPTPDIQISMAWNLVWALGFLKILYSLDSTVFRSVQASAHHLLSPDHC